MVILHIASISDDPCNGVCVVVPQHIIAQANYADVALLNIRNIKIDGVSKQFDYTEPFDIENLEAPFNKPDLVVFQEAYRKEHLRISANLRKNKIPYVILPHGELGDEAQKKKWLKKKVANVLLFNHFIDNSVAIQCLSQREYDNTHFGKKKIIATNGMTIPNETKDSFNSDKTEFVYVGRLDAYHKGIDILVDAVGKDAQFLREHNCSFRIYGPDIYGRGAIVDEMIEKNKVADLIKRYEPISGKEKEKVLLSGDIFIQTSRFEGMPLGILEAMSYGLPCLVTEGTTLGKDIALSRSGWNADTSVDSVAEVLIDAINDIDNYKMIGCNARKYVKSNFEWTKIAQETIDKYKGVL